MSDQERIKELESDLHSFKIALTNAKAIEQSYLSFGPVFDELFKKMDVLEKRCAQMQDQINNHQNMIVKALQEKYRGGTS